MPSVAALPRGERDMVLERVRKECRPHRRSAFLRVGLASTLRAVQRAATTVDLLVVAKDAQPAQAIRALLVAAAAKRAPVIVLSGARDALGSALCVPRASAIAIVNAAGCCEEDRAASDLASLAAFLGPLARRGSREVNAAPTPAPAVEPGTAS